jgi:protein-tyrosine phosphatase
MGHLVAEAGLAGRISVDSAGTGDWHVGEPPDPRTQAVARRRGFALDHHRAQLFTAKHFARYDLILAMDQGNLRDLERMAPTAGDRAKLRLLRSFDPAAPKDAEVPDPYYGGPGGFDEVFDICEAACRGLLAHLLAELG